MSVYFSDASFRFLRALARNNSREWFHENKADYEKHVRVPFQRLLGDLQPLLANVSTHYRSEPASVGGSLFRIHRDTRFAHDKTPYKSWQGARLFHERRREVESPSFHIHLQPGKCFVGAGLWHPQPDTLRRIRHFVLDNPEGWRTAAHQPAFRRRYQMDDSQMLVRAPRGFPQEFEFVEDLRRRNFVAIRSLEDDVLTGSQLLASLGRDLQGMAPFVDYLCAALDLEF
ncbi:MAG: DUF2461 domain-containing protein [Pseudomonadota bacterium]|nr:DUF2461 domain-containing protein [Pseudomonadota bacterium]